MRTQQLTAALLLATSGLSAQAMEILVPAYFYPSSNPALSQWDEMTAAASAAVLAGTRITAIMNPDNGPGTTPNADYSAAVSAFRAAGGRVLGYVYTCYGGSICNSALPPTHSAAQVLAEAQRYTDWYGVDGIFLDEMSNLASDLPFYTAVADGLRAARPGASIFGNPGTSTLEAYLAVADTLVTFERGTASYTESSSQPWMTTAAPARQAHLHYNVTGVAAMQTLVQQAYARHAGYIYITDDRYTPGNPAEDNPWDQLPSYFAAEIAAVSSVPEPGSVALLGAGALTLLAALGRRQKRGL